MSDAPFSAVAVFGGPDTVHLDVHVRRLNQLFEKYHGRVYCSGVDKFLVRVTVDGCLTQKMLNGVGTVSLYRSGRYIAGEIGVTVATWEGKAPLEMRLYHAACFREMFDRMAKRLNESEFDFDSEAYNRDTEAILEEFVAEPEPYGKSRLEPWMRQTLELLARYRNERPPERVGVEADAQDEEREESAQQ